MDGGMSMRNFMDAAVLHGIAPNDPNLLVPWGDAVSMAVSDDGDVMMVAFDVRFDQFRWVYARREGCRVRYVESLEDSKPVSDSDACAFQAFARGVLWKADSD